MMTKMEENKLIEATKKMRLDCLRMSRASGKEGMHFGGSLSMIEIAAVLYLSVGNVFPDEIDYEKRDRIIISKGHGIPAVYAALRQLGRITEEELDSFKSSRTELYAHPAVNKRLGVEFSSGSLGQGLSLGVGCALALRHKHLNQSRVYVVLGDGECNEGSVWEAALSARKYRLNRLCAIIDRNALQYDGKTSHVLPMEPLREKWESFGWDVLEIDGHSVRACQEAFLTKTDKPLVVIASTVKGKGISFMENQPEWHFGQMTAKQFEQAWGEIINDRVLF